MNSYRAAANKGFAIAGGLCTAGTLVMGGTLVLRTKVSGKTHAIANLRNVSGQLM